MRQTTWLALVLLSSWLHASCSSDDSGSDENDTGGGDQVPQGPGLDELPQMFAEMMCREFEACLGSQTVESYMGEGGCEERFTASIEDSEFPFAKDSIEAGRVVYNPDKMDSCFASVEGIGCDLDTARVFSKGVCAEVFVGSVDLGGDCAMDQDCAGGNAYCKIGEKCPGTCTALLSAGEECGDDDECADGLECSEITGECVAPAGKGMKCGGGTGPDCQLGTSCMGDDDGVQGTCMTMDELLSAGLGQECDPGGGTLCQEGLSCAINADRTAFECTELVNSGGFCDIGVPSQCPSGEYCSGTDFAAGKYRGVCESLPEEGEACIDTADMEGGCAPGLLCEVDGKCHGMMRLGEACLSDDGCASGICQGDVCVRPKQCTL